MSIPPEPPASPPALPAPWLQPLFEQLERTHAAGRNPPALLIHEQRGAGGEVVAQYAARLALCSGPAPPCGRCRDCRLFEAGQHPDFLSVTPAQDSRLIRVEQIRELCAELALTAHGGRASVALISPADSMNTSAANALLKTLEEPRAGVTLILVSAAPSRLPATVTSRCRRLRVAAPSRRQSLAWLGEQRGAGPWEAVLDVLGEAPFEALALDPAAVARLKADTERALEQAAAGRLEVAATAEAWGRADSYELRLSCVENWLTARVDHAFGPRRDPPELRSGAHSVEPGSDSNMAKLLRVLDGVYELRRLRLSSINRPLALEPLLYALAADAGAAAVGRGH